MRFWSPKSTYRSLLTAVLACLLGGCVTSSPLMAVRAPVSDLRAQPHTEAQAAVHDPFEETQLLYGESVRVVKSQDGWAYVEAVEQPEFTHAHRWQGYPGWLPLAALAPWQPLLDPTIVVTERWASTWQEPQLLTPSPLQFPLGTRLRATEMGDALWRVELLTGGMVWMRIQDAHSLEELHLLSPFDRRRMILHNAQLLLGESYYWGGRSPSGGPDGVHGVDCSGLVNLAYRGAGVDVPRDAHEQFLRAKRVKALQPGDLVFLSERGNPQHIVHVMLYAGNGELIEGPGTGKAVRRISMSERLGQSPDWITPGAVIDDQSVFFGSFLP